MTVEQTSADVWVPDDNPHQARRVNKSIEEAGELIKVLARINNQGLDGIDPETGKSNRLWLMEELADVRAQSACTVNVLKLDEEFINRRTLEKIDLMTQWEAHFFTSKS